MPEVYAQLTVSGLAALSAAAFICALFYPLLVAPRKTSRVEAYLAALRGDGGGMVETRNVRRAQEIALKAVAESNRSRSSSRLQVRLSAAGLTWRPKHFMALSACLGLTAICAGSISRMPFAVIVAGAAFCGWFLPTRFLANLAARRQRAFLAGFAGAVDMIVRGVRSGLSVTDCLNTVASDAAVAVREEFETLVTQLRAGVPLPDAMARFGAAMPLPEVRFFALIMSMQSQTGGNLSGALANLSKVLHDRQQLAAKVRVASAEVRASAIAVGVMPLAVTGAVMALAPSYIAVLWTDETGRKVAAMAAVWLLAGVAVLRRMSRVEV